MKKTEDVRAILKEMEAAAKEIEAMREADILHNILTHGYKAIRRKGSC